MKKALLVIVLLLSAFVPFISNGQGWQWAKTSNCHDTFGIEGFLIKTDKSDNVYVAGYNTGDNTCLGSYSFYHPYLTSLYYGQTVIAKYDPSGNVLWAIAGTNGNSAPIGMTIDSKGNLYVLGYYGRDSIMFGSQLLINPAYIPTTYERANYSYFIVKIDPSGTVSWIKGGGHVSVGQNLSTGGIATDAADNVYITSTYSDATLQIGSTILSNSSPSKDEIFFAKYDTLGNVLWAKSFGGSQHDEGYNLSIGSDNKIYVSGTFGSPSISFGSSIINYSASHTASQYTYNDIFLAKFDTAGNNIWAKSSNGNGDAYCMAIDRNDNIYIGGDIRDTAFSFGGLALHDTNLKYGGLLLKLDSSGNAIWGKALCPTTTINYFFPNIVFGITTDNCNNVWMSGGMDSSGGMRLDASTVLSAQTGTFHIPCGETWSDPFFLVAYDNNGTLLNHQSLSSGGDDNSAIASDSKGNIYLCADFRIDSMVFGTDTLYLSTHELENFLVAKYNTNIFCQTERTAQENSKNIDEFTLYPNPTSSACTISYSGAMYANAKVSIFDITGRLWHTYRLTDSNTTISTADLAPGMYQCRIDVDGVSMVTKKLVVMR